MSNVNDIFYLNERQLNRFAKRKRAEARFKLYGIAAIAISFIFLVSLLSTVIGKGYSAFWKTEIRLTIHLDNNVISAYDNPADADYMKLVKQSLRDQFPEVKKRQDKRQLYQLISSGARQDIAAFVIKNPNLIGSTHPIWVTASSDVDMFVKGNISRDVEEFQRKLKDKQITWFDSLEANGHVRSVFNWNFLQAGDSRNPELAGVWGSFVGSIFTILACMIVALPIGVMTAVYLEEFAPKNKITDIIEVNLNNLAAVPSIVFGLLGLFVFLGLFGMPRSAPLVGGITLSLMVLPTVVITTRNALKAVPPSIRDAALALGASPLQVAWHQTVPLAMPGIMTGAILSVARALGETAPLLMIGMVAFVADIPQGLLDPSTTMPVQVYLWADSPEMGYIERTSAAIMILLLLLIAANALAVYLRKRYEIRW